MENEPLLDAETLRTEIEKVKAAQSGSDRAYQAAAKKVKELEAENESLKKRITTEGDIISRLDKINQAFEAKEAAREIEFYARVKCLDEGIPFKLVENETFPDREAVDSRLLAIGETLEEIKVNGINAVLQSTRKPQAGDGSGPTDPNARFKNMTMESLNELFKANKL